MFRQHVQAQDPKVVMLFSSPRTASNLLVRMLLSRQTNVRHTEYHFSIDVIKQKNRIEKCSISEMSSEERDEICGKYQDATHALCATLDAARNDGLTLFNKEHCVFVLNPYLYSDSVHGSGPETASFTATIAHGSTSRPRTNPTVLPDDLLSTFMPIFLIRHPALTMASYARVTGRWTRGISDDVSLQWCKDLYLWYTSHEGTTSSPIILDADDILTSPAILYKIADLTGLDRDQIVFTWDMDNEEGKKAWHPVKLKMTKSLANSTGIVTKGKLGSELNVENEIEKWKKEFRELGESVPEVMETMLRKEMVIYEFLRERRLKVDDV